jgi:hypothetical protein
VGGAFHESGSCSVGLLEPIEFIAKLVVGHSKRIGASRAMSLAQRIEFVAETTSSLSMRAIAAWYASGVEWGKERRNGRSDLGAPFNLWSWRGCALTVSGVR